MTAKPTCITCPYSFQHPNDELGKLMCMRFPPTVMMDASGHYERFPYVHLGDWCGEHPDFPKGIEAVTPKPSPSFSHGRGRVVEVRSDVGRDWVY